MGKGHSKKNQPTASDALDEATRLRRAAEAQLQANPDQPRAVLSEVETRRVTHELEVHQIELEMQNAELRNSRDEVESLLAKFTDLYDFAPVGYITLTRDGVITSLNLHGAELLGEARSRLLGQRFGLYVQPEQRADFAAFLDVAFASPDKVRCELSLLERAGNAPVVQLNALAVESGQECRIAFLDISKLKRVEKTLRESEKIYRAIGESIDFGIWICAPDGRNLYASASFLRLVGLTQEECSGFGWGLLLHPDDAEHTIAAWKECVRTEGVWDIEHRYRGVDGNWHPVLARGVPVRDDQGKLIYWAGINLDISRLKQAEEALQRAYDELETRVASRTEELSAVNAALVHEVAERRQAEESLRRANAEILALKNRLQAENQYLQQEIARDFDFEEMIGRSKSLQQVFLRVEQVAPMDATVLLLGETGTGKGVLARAIHARSARKGRPLITVNCSALPANLIESELFGREKGAFTGAASRQIGRFELADGGTLFLDEIGEMPLELQCKLLRVIQEGEFERLGSPRTVKVDVRLIAASNRNLEEAIRDGRFREDLYYRLNVFPISLPPLRQRREDIPLLVEYFVDKFNKKNGKRIETLSSSTLGALQGYDWPGNVRELENVIERAVITSPGSELQVLDRLVSAHSPSPPLAADLRSLEELERDHILQVLQQTGWRIEGPKGAALILGLNASTLRARMRKLDISRH